MALGSLNARSDGLQLWLNEGRLLVIPLQQPAAHLAEKMARTITLHEALRFVQENRPKLMHSALIEAEAFYRLQKYPKQVEDSLHYSLVKIPRRLAFILHEKAALISPAVEAFYLRDPIALRPLQTQDAGKLVFPPNDLVIVSVKFTKVGFAQIKSQQFPVSLAWKSQFSTEMDAKAQSRIDLGMKVTCGFEMLLSDPQNIDDPSVREIKLLVEDLETDESCMPLDAEILKWGARDDDESWLDIDFENFESELAGKANKNQSHTDQGFGDKNAQDKLRKMVRRFEDFLNDDKAGAEGVEYLDDMDNDDEEIDDRNDPSNGASEDSDSESEDKDISFDEDQFARMMREMMGMPADTATDVGHGLMSEVDGDNIHSMHSTDVNIHSVDDEEGLDIRQAMHDMEAELEDAGALHQHSKRSPDKNLRVRQNTEAGHSSTMAAHESDTDDDVDIDYNLAKNLLESFKSQNGAAGPGGNLMGLMGMRFPRDNHDDGQKL